MQTPAASSNLDEEASLAARAAWLYFSAGLKQGEVAERLGVPGTKAHRLIARATRDGMVRVFVDGQVSECVELEGRLSARFGLDHCRVAPDLGEPGLPLRALGLSGAAYLRQLLEGGRHACLGIGHGRTIAASVNEMPAVRAPDTTIVSLLGGLTRKFAANPFDVIHRLAERTGSAAYMMPVPLYANTAADRDVLMAQMGVAEVRAMWAGATILLAGIGGIGVHAHLSEVGSVTEAELDEIRAKGAVAEMLGHYFDADGAPVSTSLEGRVMAPPLDELRGRMLVAIAGGPDKAPAIGAVLKSGFLKGLITDEATARRLVERMDAD